MRVAGLLLAAGAGRRIGTPKALVSVHGRPLVARGVMLLAAAGCAPVLVTVGAAAGEVTALLADPALPPHTVVPVAAWDTGMGASVRAGLAALPGDVDAVVVALVDQPFVTSPLIRRLWDTAAADPGPAAVVAAYGGQPRNPVLLRREIWDEVADRAQGDIGARAWLRSHPRRVRTVACDDVGRPDDLDTQADLDRIRETRSSGTGETAVPE